MPGLVAQAGDPTGTGKGGSSIYGELFGEQARFFEDEIHRKLRHESAGTVSMANTGPNTNASQFFITASAGQSHLDDVYTTFGIVAEGLEVVQALSNAYADADGRPYQNLRIRHTIVLDDPFDDPPGLQVPDASPGPSEHVQRQDRERMADGEELEDETRTAEEIEEALQTKAAESRAQVLEMLGDLPDADIPPPENVLFVCKLNPVTEDDDLELIFGRFGDIKSCQARRSATAKQSIGGGMSLLPPPWPLPLPLPPLAPPPPFTRMPCFLRARAAASVLSLVVVVAGPSSSSAARGFGEG